MYRDTYRDTRVSSERVAQSEPRDRGRPRPAPGRRRQTQPAQSNAQRHFSDLSVFGSSLRVKFSFLYEFVVYMPALTCRVSGVSEAGGSRLRGSGARQT